MFHLLVALCCILALSEATPLNKKAVPVKDIKSRIINGENARLGQLPWQVALYIDTYEGTYFCGGSIISSQWVLTAAHCVEDANEFTVLAGTLSSSLNGGSNQNKRTTDFIQHERYNYQTLANDLGLVRVGSSWTLNNNVQVISLSTSGPGSGDRLTVSGWGLTSDSSNSISSSLKFVEVVLISHNQCEDTYGDLDQGIICTNSGGNQHKSTCSGDSGGPLVSDPTGSSPKLQGVVSFGASDGCDLGFPDGYSGVSHFTSWISQNTDV